MRPWMRETSYVLVIPALIAGLVLAVGVSLNAVATFALGVMTIGLTRLVDHAPRGRLDRLEDGWL